MYLVIYIIQITLNKNNDVRSSCFGISRTYRFIGLFLKANLINVGKCQLLPFHLTSSWMGATGEMALNNSVLIIHKVKQSLGKMST